MTDQDLEALAAALVPVMRSVIAAALEPLAVRLAAVEARPIVAGRDGRDGVPGAPGVPGPPGVDGVNGRDGVDGLGFDDLSMAFDGERVLTLNWRRGELERSYPVTLPTPCYRGVYSADQAYQPGDMVTRGGSLWMCKAETAAMPAETPESAAGWVLCVKRGGEGKPGPKGERGERGERGEPGSRGPAAWGSS